MINLILDAAMNTPDVQPPFLKPNKKLLSIRILAYTLVVIFLILIGYVAGRVFPSKSKIYPSVLGSQWPTFPPATPTPFHWPTFPTATPTPQPNHWPTFPPATPTTIPTQQSNQWPTFPTPTPFHWPTYPTATPTLTPTPQANHWPTPSPTNVPLTAGKIKQMVNNVGVNLSASGISMNTGTNSYTVKGSVPKKILGLIQISTPVTLTVDSNGVISGSIAKPWWQKIFPFTIANPFAGLPSEIDCSSITDGFKCWDHTQCNFWEACGKCVPAGTPYDPQCPCTPNKKKDACDNTYGCKWYKECAGGGACADAGTSSQVACGGCGNVIGVDACNKQGSGCWIDSNCGRCEEHGVIDPSCTCDSVKTKSGCDKASNCKWHPECAGGEVCTPWFDSNDKYINSKVACGGCAYITDESDCTNSGCIYSNNQCQ